MALRALFTLDLEDHTGVYSPHGRHVDNAKRILDLCDGAGIRGTVFVVGRLAEASPGLVREVSVRGHEIACHSWAHVSLDRLGAEAFRADTIQAKAVLEDVTGQPVHGYRAPIFSLTQKTMWAPDILAELGFKYSSSVMPAPNPLHGLPGAPTRPFRWPSGLNEFPCPVKRLGPLTLPYLGGIYLRYLPMPLVRAWAAKTSDSVRWTYCHPYDFDADEPFTRIAGAGLLTSFLLWLNRRNTWSRIAEITGGTERLGDVAAHMEGLETWTPSIS